MRSARITRRRGRCPLTPRDTWGQKMEWDADHFLSPNIPAGGSDAAHPRAAMGSGAQNSSFKNFADQSVGP